MSKLTIYDTMDRRIQFKVREINKGVRNKNTIVNRGSGYLYIIENSEIEGWFKIGMVTTKDNFTQRINKYRHTIPIGEWRVLYFEPKEDIALEELRAKHYSRYKLGYKWSPYSKEWFNGDWTKIDII